jgi:beta-galactosidase
MKKLISITLVLILNLGCLAQNNARTVVHLEKDWQFINKDVAGAQMPETDTAGWETVTVPHDWAIKGPFDKEIDKQVVRVTQDLEKEAKERTGRTGALPHIGVGWYRKSFTLGEYKKGKKVLLVFDGAMSDAHVFVNGKEVGNWPCGYNYFYFDITDYLKGGENLLAVRLENPPFSSRWYPGAGIYRKVQIIVKDEVNFQQWGTFVTTPFISDEMAKINIKSAVNGENVKVVIEIKDADGKIVAMGSSDKMFGNQIELNIGVPYPKLWGPETPYLYTAHSKLYQGTELKDELATRFAVRSVVYDRDKGMVLNGKVIKFKGVCLHHDQGPLGAAVNKSALKRQITILKDMGCNAIRSSHNMPSHEQLELCDEMGILFMAEAFDEWVTPKVENGYNRWFNEWAQKDVENFVRATRNHPCIVMWSSGNEVPDQSKPDGPKLARRLQDIFHREDPTRSVTVGMDQVESVMANGFGAVLDVPGLNYRVHLYEEAYERFPQGLLIGAETASTVSSRGVYKFPVEKLDWKTWDDLQCSSYDMVSCSWSNLPEEDFVLQDDKDWVIGEFVWTGFDYLGEPTPYGMEWPSRSSYFGICDLAGLPKDRYYLYRSRWNTTDETLHILPHWNWQGREGEITPVFVYTNYNSAELFVNGVSQGIQKKNFDTKQNRYRLMWMDVKYEPGTVKVVAFDDNGKALAQKEIHTAGKPHHLELSADRKEIAADGKDLGFVTVSVVDKDGISCPTASNQLNFKVSGAGRFKAACNGDATSLEMFHLPTMKAFSGKLVVLVQSCENGGDIELEVTGKGLETAKMAIASK